MTTHSNAAARTLAARFMAIVLALVLLALGGCYGGFPLIGAEAAALESAEDKRKFKEALNEGKFRYKAEMAESGCPPADYKISKGILDFAEARAPYGMDEAIKHLTEIAANAENSDDVRAEALYHKGVAQLYKGEFSRQLTQNERNRYYGQSRTTFESLQALYPDSHECATAYHLQRLDELANRESSAEDAGAVQ